MTAAQIDHSTHDHPATKEARAKCRAERRRYPAPESPGSVFETDDGGLWQRLVLSPDIIQRDDVVAGFDVVGVSTDARHDNAPAFRFDLYQEGITGRLVVQADPRVQIQVYREFDPEMAEISVDIDVSDAQTGTGEDGPARMLNYLLGLVGGTNVKPQVLTWAGPDQLPVVRLIGPRRHVVRILQVHDPENWEKVLLASQLLDDTLEQIVDTPMPPRPKVPELSPWQHDRVEKLLGGKMWRPVRIVRPALSTPAKTIFNQDMRDGWRLEPTDGTPPRRFVGRELMRVLIELYPELLDLPEGFMP